ncbi:MAG TPA: tetratricopeptide repeat protein [Spirochaetia bacterium]|nr:tetratricopeptide repeat protein [Spirochaetia bacterium]
MSDRRTSRAQGPGLRAASSGTSNPRLVGLSRAGYRALEKRRLDEAQRWFDQMLQVEARNTYALVGLAEVARKRNDLKGALGWFTQCLEAEPSNPFALKGAAECAWELRDYRRCVQAWETLLEVSGPDASVLTHLADGYRRLGDPARSEAAYRRALEMDPTNRYALNGLGNLLFDAERYADAAEAWDRLLHRDPSNVQVLVCRGNCERKLRDFQRGLLFFTEAARIQRDNFYALYGIADCHRGLGSHEKSLETWLAILRASPGNRIILTRAGDACRSIGELDQAERYYREALSLGFDLYAEIGIALIQMIEGSLAPAVNRLQRLLEREPSNPRVLRALADCERAAAGEAAAAGETSAAAAGAQ